MVHRNRAAGRSSERSSFALAVVVGRGDRRPRLCGRLGRRFRAPGDHRRGLRVRHERREELGAAALSEWQPQLIAQLHRCVGGAAPLRPIVNIGCSFTELVLAPVHTWRSHGLVLRGLRHGGGAFFRHVLVETLSVAEGVLLLSQGVLDALGAEAAAQAVAQGAMLAANPQRVVTLSE